MPRKKKVATVTADVPASEAPAVVAVEESVAKQQFRAYMESYKIANPVKYARKEAELLNKLNSL